MSQKTFLLTVAVLFSLIGLLHLLRLVFGWEAIVGGLIVPMWISWVAILVTGYLAYEGLRLGKRS
ncbi:MAG: hypothetical protein HYX73_07365 [Acidobacteria bacterium]|nr:hypothetical protein [Acidobacteriota bacterium]